MRKVIKLFFIILSIDILMMVLFVILHMTDGSLTILTYIQEKLLKYICGFPLVLINNEYPFFLSSVSLPRYMFPIVVANIIFQIIMIKIISKLNKKLR